MPSEHWPFQQEAGGSPAPDNSAERYLYPQNLQTSTDGLWHLCLGIRQTHEPSRAQWGPEGWRLLSSSTVVTKVTHRSTQKGTSLVVQCERIRLAMQGTQVRSLVRGTKIPHAVEQLKPMSHIQRVHAPQWEIPRATMKIPSAATETWCSQIDK